MYILYIYAEVKILMCLSAKRIIYYRRLLTASHCQS